jgi:hypothetical protein
LPTPTDPLRKITVRLPASLIKVAKLHAVQTDQDLQDVVHAALVRYLAKKGGR